MKKKVKKVKAQGKYNETWLGVSGFTLSIAGLVLAIIGPFAALFTTFMPIIFLAIALVFAIIQQKKNPTKFGKISLILGIIGVVIFIIWTIVLFKVLLPLAQQAMQ